VIQRRGMIRSLYQKAKVSTTFHGFGWGDTKKIQRLYHLSSNRLESVELYPIGRNDNFFNWGTVPHDLVDSMRLW